MRTREAVTLAMLLFFAAVIRNVEANSSDQNPIYCLGSFEMWVEYPSEAYPNETITINVTIKAWTDLIVNFARINLTTFNSLTKEEDRFHIIEYVSSPENLAGGESLNETSYEVQIPDSATRLLFGKMMLKWTIMGTEESTVYERRPTIIMTLLGNPELEQLRSKVPELEMENAELNDTVANLLNNLTNIEDRYEGELSGTRSVITILAITTVFFVATTAYLFIRKPKQYW